MLHHGTAHWTRAEKLPSPVSAALQTGSPQQHLCATAHSPYGDLLVIQVCSDATSKHCSTGHGRVASPLISAAVQNRLTA
ncbi:TPA: hypothetical protein ACH3X1_016006, partial [Trebouxia sp. C0004]